MNKTLRKSNKIIILSVFLLAFFCLSGFNSPNFSKKVSAMSAKASEEGGTANYFFGDFIKAEGTTYRDLGITGYYSSSDSIDVPWPEDPDQEDRFFGYYNVSFTTNTGTSTEYTLNIYNLFAFETSEITESTVMEISTTHDLRFYITNWHFYPDKVGEDIVSFIPINKTINLFSLLNSIYPDEMSEGDPDLYPGTPQYSFNIDTDDILAELFYTTDLKDNNDAEANFSRNTGFVIGQNGYINNGETDTINYVDGVYWYYLYENTFTWYYNTNGRYGTDKVYLKFDPLEYTAGGFNLADESLKVDHVGPLGQGYTFDFAQVNGYGDRYDIKVGQSNALTVISNSWTASNTIDYRVVDFNTLQLSYDVYYGEIYTLYQLSIVDSQAPILMRQTTNTADLLAHLWQYNNGKYYYNSFACCFSPYVGEVNILSTNIASPKYVANQLASIITGALWVVAPLLMLGGSIVQGIISAKNGGSFLDGFTGWSTTIRDGLADFGKKVSDFFTDPKVPEPVETVSKNPVTWLLVILAVIIALGVSIFIKKKK